MTVGILQCGDPPEALRAGHGSYGGMMQLLLGPERDTTVYDLVAGTLPASVTAHGAYLLTGSPAGVYEDLPWIVGLTEFLKQAKGRAKLVGICFGHQAMAQAFGGSVVKSPSGWGIGLQRYEVKHRAPWMGDAERWDALRPMTVQELKATSVLWMDIEEATAKVRAAPPGDPEDAGVPVWAGVLPMRTTLAAAQPAPELPSGVELPEPLAKLIASGRLR